jgi:hypothetical protein
VERVFGQILSALILLAGSAPDAVGQGINIFLYPADIGSLFLLTGGLISLRLVAGCMGHDVIPFHCVVAGGVPPQAEQVCFALPSNRRTLLGVTLLQWLNSLMRKGPFV